MKDDKILMVKLFSGNFVKSGIGSGREQFNIDEKAIIGGKYYGVVLCAGEMFNISLEKIDADANKQTDKVDDITIIYFEEINKQTCIVAIAENSTVFRKLQRDEKIIVNRMHKYEWHGEIIEENVGYHIITDVNDMHLLKENYIVIDIPKECRYFFRAQRALSKEEKYQELRKQIIKKTIDYLNGSEIDLSSEQIEMAEDVTGGDGSDEDLSFCFSNNGKQINKKAWITKKALSNAKYRCEYDPAHVTFMTDRGHFFMEGHHLIRCTVKTSEEYKDKYGKNIDTVANIVSLCPNCHRRVHHGNNAEKAKILERLFEIKRDDLHKIKIPLGLEELMSIYSIE